MSSSLILAPFPLLLDAAIGVVESQLCRRGYPGLETASPPCRKLKRLQTLELCGGQVTDAGVNQLRDLRGLTALSLAHNKRITDASVPHFAGMQRLRQLNLAQSAVTDNGIQPLARIPVRFLAFHPA